MARIGTMMVLISMVGLVVAGDLEGAGARDCTIESDAPRRWLCMCHTQYGEALSEKIATCLEDILHMSVEMAERQGLEHVERAASDGLLNCARSDSACLMGAIEQTILSYEMGLDNPEPEHKFSRFEAFFSRLYKRVGN